MPLPDLDWVETPKLPDLDWEDPKPAPPVPVRSPSLAGTQPFSASGAMQLAGLPFKAAGAVIADVLNRGRMEAALSGEGTPEVYGARLGESPAQREERLSFSGAKPLIPVKGTVMQPEGSDLERLISQWSTPESMAMLPMGMTKAGAALLLTQMVPQVAQQIRDVAKGEGTDTEKRDRINNLFAMGLLAAHGGLKGERPPMGPGQDYAQPAGPLATGQVLKTPEGFTPKPEAVKVEAKSEETPPVVQQGAPASTLVPAFAAKYDPQTLMQRPAWVDPGSKLDQVLGDLRDKNDPLTGVDIAPIWKTLTASQRQDLAARGWITTSSRDPNAVVLKLAQDVPPSRKYYGVQAKQALKAPPTAPTEGAPPAAPAAVEAGAEPAVETPGAAEPAKAEVTTSQGKEQTPAVEGGRAPIYETTQSETGTVAEPLAKTKTGRSGTRTRPTAADVSNLERAADAARYARDAQVQGSSAWRKADVKFQTAHKRWSDAAHRLAEVSPAVEKVEAEVQKVAATEGQRPAKEVKTALMKRIEDEMHGAPEEGGPVIVINIPGDGEFKVFRSIKDLSALRDKVKSISTVGTSKARPEEIPAGTRGKVTPYELADKALQVYGTPEAAEKSLRAQLGNKSLLADIGYDEKDIQTLEYAIDAVADRTPLRIAERKVEELQREHDSVQEVVTEWPKHIADLEAQYTELKSNKPASRWKKAERNIPNRLNKAKADLIEANANLPRLQRDLEYAKKDLALKQPSPTPPATEGKGRGKETDDQFLKRIAPLLDKNEPLPKSDRARYATLTGRGKEPPAQGISVGPGAASPGDVPPGAQIEHLTDAFKRITAEKPSLFDRVKEAFDLGKKREMSQNIIARTLSALKTSGDYLIDTYKGQMDVDPILKVKGRLSAELETRGWRMRQAMAEMKRAVPNKLVREAISKYVDAGGDMVKLREASETVPPTRRAAYQRAMSLSPDEKVMAGHIQSFFEARLQEAMDAGVLSHGIEDYIHRIYPKDSPWRRGVINSVQNSILDTRTPGLARQRVFELDADAERAGYFPVSDFIPRILDYEASLSKVIASREAVKGFTEIKMPDGRPMLDVTGIGVPVENPEGVRDATLIKPSFRPGEKQLDENGKPTKNYRRDYQSRDYPALKRWKWATNDAQGTPIFVEGDVLIHPDAVHRIDALLEPSKVRRYPVARAALTVGSVFKQTMLDFSGFHQAQISIHGMEHKVNPFRLVKDVDTNNPDVQGLLRGGMTLGGQHVSGMYEEGLVGRSLSRQIPGLGPLMESYHNWLFQNFIPRVKTTMAMHALERNRARFANDLKSGRMTNEALYYQTAKEANAAFGELNYIMLERSKTAQDLARLVLLAPDFLEARGRFAAQALTKHGGEQRMALLLGAIALYTTARVMNKALNDEWHFEPENMFSIIHNGKAYSIRTVQGDILHLMEEPVRFWLHRLNPTITRPLFELMTGRDEFGRKRGFWQVMGDTISNAIPISMRSGREQSIWTSMLNAFGGSVRRYSDIHHVYDLADKWKQKHGVRTQPGEFIYDPSKDIYRPLKLALLDGDTPAAASEYRKLIASKLVTPEQVGKHFQTYANAPFAGSKSNEQKFYQSLTSDERKQYEGAKQERRRLLSGFRKAQSYQR